MSAATLTPRRNRGALSMANSLAPMWLKRVEEPLMYPLALIYLDVCGGGDVPLSRRGGRGGKPAPGRLEACPRIRIEHGRRTERLTFNLY